MMLAVATGANSALEDFRSNVVASVTSTAVNFVGIAITIIVGGGLQWLTFSLLASRLCDWLVRDAFRRRNYRPFLRQAERARSSFPEIERALNRQIRLLFGLTAVVEILDLLVLDRSEVLVLKSVSAIEQIAFFSIGFSLIQQVGGLARILNLASATALIRRNAEDPEAATKMTRAVLRATGLFVMPATLGIAALSGPIVSVVYGFNTRLRFQSWD